MRVSCLVSPLRHVYQRDDEEGRSRVRCDVVARWGGWKLLVPYCLVLNLTVKSDTAEEVEGEKS